jgi:hypothetical protein
MMVWGVLPNRIRQAALVNGARAPPAKGLTEKGERQMFRRRQKKRDRRKEGKVDDRIDFPLVREWRPPYWGEVGIACLITFLLGIASTATWDAWTHARGTQTPPIVVIDGRQSRTPEMGNCGRIVEVATDSAWKSSRTSRSQR